MTLPGWDSLEAVARLNFSLHVAAIVFVGLLAISEGLAFIYSERRETLTSAANDTRTEQQKQDNARRDNELTEARRAAQAANAELGRLREQRAPRHLNETQRQKLCTYLSDKPRANITIKANVSVDDAREYADEIAHALGVCGWLARVDNAIIPGPKNTGVWLTVKDANKIPPSAQILYDALVYAEIPVRDANDHTHDAALAEGELWLSVGAK